MGGGLLRRWWPLLLVLALAGAALLAYLLWGRPAGGDLAIIQRGTIRGTVDASGEVVSARQARLSSRVSGQVLDLPVTVGQEVLSGTLLLTIATDSPYRLREAELRVEIARLRLEQAQAGARPEAVAAAQAEVEQARARLEQLQAGPGGAELAVAWQEVVQAEAALAQTRQAAAVSVETTRLSWQTAANALRDAQDAYSRLYWEHERLRQMGVELSPLQQDAEAAAWRRVEDAEAAMAQARLLHERALQDQQAGLTTAEARLSQARSRYQALLTGPTAAEIAQTQALLDRAQANLDLLQAGPRASEVQILEKELQVVELRLEEVRAEIARATVTAPFTGTVVEVAVKPGEVVGIYSPLVQLADLGQLEIRARIDEIDVGLVQPGQAVTVTLDAYPGRPLRGQVIEVAPAVTVERGSAFYLTRVALDPLPAEEASAPLVLRLGMAATLSIVVAEQEDVLLVPRRAVERVGAGHYVTVVRNGRRERVRVTLGAADSLYYEALQGLSEGEQVIVP